MSQDSVEPEEISAVDNAVGEERHEERNQQEEEQGQEQEEEEEVSVISGHSDSIARRVKELAGQMRNLEDSNCCTICYNPFTNPCAFPCGHIFCQQCAEQWVARGRDTQDGPSCPKCRHKVTDEHNLVRLYSDTRSSGEVAGDIQPVLNQFLEYVQEVKHQHDLEKQKLNETEQAKISTEAELAEAKQKHAEEERKNAQQVAEIDEKNRKLSELEVKLLELQAMIEQANAEKNAAQEKVQELTQAEEERRKHGSESRIGATDSSDEGDDEYCDRSALDHSVIPASQKQNTLLYGFLTLFMKKESEEGFVSVPKMISNYALGDCATASPDEVIIRASKKNGNAGYGLKYIECHRIFLPQPKRDGPPKVYPKEAYVSFVEPYILYKLQSDGIIPLTGIVSCSDCSDAPDWLKWKRRMNANSIGFLLEMKWPRYDFQYHSAVSRSLSDQAEFVALQLFQTLARLHGHGVVHRRVAPWNIRVLDATSSYGKSCPICLAGFGCACTPEGDATFVPPMLPANSYSPPEMFSRSYCPKKFSTDKNFWTQCDVWAAACVIVETLIGTRGRPLFCPRILRCLETNQARGIEELLQTHPGLISRYPVLRCIHSVVSDKGDCNNFIVDVEELCRMVCPDVLNPRTRVLAKLMTDVLVGDPSKRLSAVEVVRKILENGEVLNHRSFDDIDDGTLPPITMKDLNKFARHNCSFLFQS